MSHDRFHVFRRGLRKAFLRYAFAPIVAVGLLAAGALFYLYEASIRGNVQTVAGSAAAQMEEGVAPYLRQIALFARDGETADALQGAASAGLAQRLYDFVNAQTIPSDFYLLTADLAPVLCSNLLLPDYLLAEQRFGKGLFKRAALSSGETAISLAASGNRRREGGMALTLVRAVGQGESAEGYLVFEINRADLLESLRFGRIGDLLIVDRHYTAMLSTNDAYLDQYGKLATDFRAQGDQSVATQDGRYYVARRDILPLGLSVYAIAELDVFLHGMRTAALALLLMLLTLSAGMFVVAGRVARSKTASLDALADAIQTMREQGVQAAVSLDTHDEFRIFSDTYNRMLADIRTLVEKNKEEVRRSNRAEIRQLEAQFNPHFIFNTLEVVRCFMLFDVKRATEILLRLSDMLRYSISRNEQIVPLMNDIRYLEGYFFIHKGRYEDRLAYTLDISPEAESLMIPKLLLQPLVENAIKYGIGRKQVLRVDVRARVEGKTLLLTVSDNGEGIDPAVQSELERNMRLAQNPTEHFGMDMVHRRVTLMFGAAYGLAIRSTPGKGTEVTISLPVMKDVPEHVQSGDR